MDIETNTDLETLLEKRFRLRKNFTKHLEQFRVLFQKYATGECGRVLFILKGKAERLHKVDELIVVNAKNVWSAEEKNEDFEKSEKYYDEMLSAEYDFQQIDNTSCLLELENTSTGSSIKNKTKCENDSVLTRKRKKIKSTDCSHDEPAAEGPSDEELSSTEDQNDGGVRKKIRFVEQAVDDEGYENLRLGDEDFQGQNKIKFTANNDDGNGKQMRKKRSGLNVLPVITQVDLVMETSFNINETTVQVNKATGISNHILNGRDVLASPPTAYGKPTPYLRTIVNILLEEATPPFVGKYGAEPRCVIVAPSPELVQQIHGEALKLIEGSALSLRLACRDLPLHHWSGKNSDGHHILVCKSTELVNLVANRQISLSSVRFFILDDVNQKMSRLFSRHLNKIMNKASIIPKTKRQTLFFSVKLPIPILLLAEELMNNYIYTIVASNIKQTVLKPLPKKKIRTLLNVLREWDGERVLVFAQRQKADWLTSRLTKIGLHTDNLKLGTGDKLHRENAVDNFNSGTVPILVTSSEGLSKTKNIEDVTHFINFELPANIEEYVWRISSMLTGEVGFVTSFYDPMCNAELAPHLVQILSDNQQEVPPFLTSDFFDKGSTPLGDTRNVIQQNILEARDGKKIKTVIPILLKQKKIRTLVLVNKRINWLTRILNEAGVTAVAVKDATKQQSRIQNFLAGCAPILVTTLEAVKNFDVRGVAHLVLFDLPKTIKAYKKRINQAFLEGQCGLVTSFYNPLVDALLARRLVKALSASQQKVPAFLTRDAAVCQQEIATEDGAKNLETPFGSRLEAAFLTDVADDLEKVPP